MIEWNSLVIIQTAVGLQASLCRVGLRTCEMLYTQEFAGDCDTQDNIASILSKLKNALKALQLPAPRDIRLCLNPEMALFREWNFPFRSRNKIKQSLALLLNAEFPFGAETLEHRTYYAKTSPQSKNTPLISVSCASNALQMWFDAFDTVDWYPSLVTFDPFPLLYALPKNDGIQLVLHTQTHLTTVSLVENGCVRRIRVISQGLENKLSQTGNSADKAPDIKAFLRDIAVVLDGSTCKPTQLILFGDCFLQAPLRSALEQALDLPSAVLGQDIPYANNTMQTGERSLGRLAALALARMPAWAWRLQSRCPSFHRQQRKQSIVFERYHKYIAPTCAAGLVIFGYLVATWADGYALHEQATYYETQMRETFLQAAPEARNISSMRQMRSVLSNKIQAGEDTYNTSQTSYFILKALNTLHEAVSGTFQVRLNRISFDRGRCQLSGVAGSYEQVENIRQEIAKLDNVEAVNILRATAEATGGASTTQQNAQNTGTAPAEQNSIAFDLVVVFAPNDV